MKKQFNIAFLIFLFLFGLSACGGGSKGNAPDLIDVVISSSSVNPIIGKEFILKANAIFSDRTSQEITADAEWRLSDDTLASIDSTGKITPNKVGEITVFARYRHISGEKTYSISDIPRISSITASGVPSNFTEGNERQLTVKITNSDKTEVTDAFDTVTFTSSNEDILSVDTKGLVKALSYGNADITITSKNSDANTVIAVNVLPSVKSLNIDSERFYLDLESKDQFIVVTATLTDGTEHDYTGRVSWKYSTTNEADSFSSISEFFHVESSGKLSPQIAGTYYIKPILDGLTGEQTATVIVEDPISLATLVDSQKEIVVSWNAKTDASEYRLYWNTAGNISQDTEDVNIESIKSSTKFSLPNVDTNKTYYFRIAFLRENQTQPSPLSTELAIKPLKRQWQHKPGLPSLRQGSATILFGEELLIFGGQRINDNGELSYSNLVSKFSFQAVTQDDGINNSNYFKSDEHVMPASRSGMAACLYKNYIYIFGGTNSDETITNQILKYDPVLGTWTTTGITTLPVNLTYLSCNTNGDKIYLIGGTNGSSASNKVYIFDPLNESSEIKEGPSLHFARYKHASLVSDNKIYVTGGINSDGTEATFESINPETETEWTLLPRLENSRYGFGLGIYNNKIYAFGGYNSENLIFQKVESFDISVPNTVWKPELPMPYSYAEFGLITKDSTFYFYGGNNDTNSLDSYTQAVHFDASLNIWFPNAAPQVTVTDFGSAVLGNQLFIAGGRLGIESKNEMQVFNFESNTWGGSDEFNRRPNSLEEPRFRAAAISFKGSIYVIGGYKNINNSALKTVERYEINSNTWQTAGSLNIPRGDACAVEFRNQIYVFGGSTIEIKDNQNMTVPVNSYEIFDPASRLWINRGLISTTPRIGSTCVALNDRIYIIGGLVADDSGKLKETNRVDEYNPLTSKFSTNPADMKFARVKPAAVVLNGSVYVFGGFTSEYDERILVTSAEKFLPYNKIIPSEGNGWTNLPSMMMGFHNLDAHIVNNKIILIGSQETTDEQHIQNYITIFE